MGKSFSLNFILFMLVFYVLKMGRDIFLPFVVAMFFWCLIYILHSAYSDLFLKRFKWPSWTRYLARPLAILTITAIMYFIIVGIKSNIYDVSQTFGTYQKNIADIIKRVTDILGLEKEIQIAEVVKDVDIPKLINRVIQGFANFISDATMVIVYIVFLMLEEKSLIKKVPLLFKTQGNLKQMREIFHKIFSKIRIYMMVKSFTSILTGVLCYIIMRAVGLDFAMFWAILIFLLNFIPTVGSIVASVFPVLLSLLQFNGELMPFAVVTLGIAIVQILIGNILDPKVMGSRLNLSPLVLILSLVIWGNIWGIMGMFLCVPILIIATIVLYQIPSTKKIAIILTKNGNNF